MEKMIFPESPQSALWRKLTAKQQAEVAAVFRPLKKPSQVKLCSALTDYIYFGNLPEFAPEDWVLAAIFVYLTSYGMEEKASWLIEPRMYK